MKELERRVTALESEQRVSGLDARKAVIGSINGVPATVEELAEMLIQISRRGGVEP